jgi:hypothetical protein
MTTRSESLGGNSRDPLPAAQPPGLPPPVVLRRRRRFFTHVIVFVAGAVLLTAAWLITGLATESWFYWPLFVLLGWALLLDLHAWWAYRPSAPQAPPDDRRAGT